MLSKECYVRNVYELRVGPVDLGGGGGGGGVGCVEVDKHNT